MSTAAESSKSPVPNAHHGDEPAPRIGDALRDMKGQVQAFGERAAQRRHSVAYDEPWDLESADELVRVYETSGYAIASDVGHDAQPTLPRPEILPSPSQLHAAQASTVAANASPAPFDHQAIARLAADPTWLEARFTELTDRVERSIAATNPATAIADLGTRFVAFEGRIADALSNISSKPDIAALAPIEARIQSFASELSAATKQFARLDSIEAHLADLSKIAAAANAPLDEDHVHALSESPIEREHQTGGNIHALLQEFTDDRKRIDQETASALDTIQEVLVRLIDRIDQIDAQDGHAPMDDHAHDDAQSYMREPVMQDQAVMHAWAPSAPHAAPHDSADFGSAPRAPDQHVSEPETEDPIRAATFGRAPTRTKPAPLPAAAPPPELSINAETMDVTSARKDFEASALRARMKASYVQKPDAALEIPPAAPDAVAPDVVTASPNRVRGHRQPAPVEGTSKRALVLGMIGLTAVGLGYLGVDYLASSGTDARHQVGASAPAVQIEPVRVPAAYVNPAPVNPLPVAPQAPTQANSANPSPANPATAISTPVNAPPVAPPQAVVAPTKRDPGLAPAFADTPTPRAAPLPRILRDSVREPGATAQPTTPPPQFPPPRSIPETATDDITLNRQQTAPAPRGAAITTNSITPIAAAPIGAPMGMLIDTSRTPPRPEDILRLQQRRQLTAANDQTAALTATAGATVAPSSNLRPIETATLTTGSLDVDLPEAQPDTRAVTMPPAAIGPQLLRTAAVKGDPSAEFEVAVRYAEGKGVKQDFNEAMIWYQRSATHGFASAQYRLATLYERGLATGVDLQRARVWYQRAAEQGNVKAMHNLAVLSAGRKSTTPDYETAALWFTAAAERGLSDSQFNLAVLYENGLGVNKDATIAYKWFALAAKSGDKEAVRRRDIIGTKLEVADFQTAEADVDAWHAKRTDPKVNDARVAGDQWRNRQSALAQ
jgi:localization factor PodJL